MTQKNRNVIIETTRRTYRRKLRREDRDAFIAKAGNICIYCGRLYNRQLARWMPHRFFSVYQIDHIIPLARGGSNKDSNLRAVCRECNQIKSNLPLHEAMKRIREAQEHREAKAH